MPRHLLVRIQHRPAPIQVYLALQNNIFVLTHIVMNLQSISTGHLSRFLLSWHLLVRLQHRLAQIRVHLALQNNNFVLAQQQTNLLNIPTNRLSR